MGFFSTIFSWFGNFFSMVASTVIGKAAESIGDAALTIVQNLEGRADLSGEEKWKHAKSELEKKYPSIESVAINLAIESAVAIIKDKLKE